MPFGPACKMELARVTDPAAPDQPVHTTAGIPGEDPCYGVNQRSEIANAPSAMKARRSGQAWGAFVLEQVERVFDAVESVFHRSRPLI
jgi:hypothetical protein